MRTFLNLDGSTKFVELIGTMWQLAKAKDVWAADDAGEAEIFHRISASEAAKIEAYRELDTRLFSVKHGCQMWELPEIIEWPTLNAWISTNPEANQRTLRSIQLFDDYRIACADCANQ